MSQYENDRHRGHQGDAEPHRRGPEEAAARYPPSGPSPSGTRRKSTGWCSRSARKCGNIDHPPYLYCTACQADEHEWIEASGKGTLSAYAINNFGVPFPFWADLPYVVGMIDLAEGVRMISNIVECDHEQLENGMELEVVFDDVTDEITLPKWRPVKK